MVPQSVIHSLKGTVGGEIMEAEGKKRGWLSQGKGESACQFPESPTREGCIGDPVVWKVTGALFVDAGL